MRKIRSGIYCFPCKSCGLQLFIAVHAAFFDSRVDSFFCDTCTFDVEKPSDFTSACNLIFYRAEAGHPSECLHVNERRERVIAAAAAAAAASLRDPSPRRKASVTVTMETGYKEVQAALAQSRKSSGGDVKLKFLSSEETK